MPQASRGIDLPAVSHVYNLGLPVSFFPGLDLSARASDPSQGSPFIGLSRQPPFAAWQLEQREVSLPLRCFLLN